MSKIEWTGESWNPIVGCSLATPGCTNCYAMTMASRLEAMGTPAYQGLTQPSKAGPVWTGKLAFSESALLKPLQRQKPQTYFVNSMGDLFHEDCPDEWIDRVFAVMALCPQHTFQVLTKRSGRMREYCSQWSGDWSRTDAVWEQIHRLMDITGADTEPREIILPAPNVWLGVSVEDQQRADERIPDLLATRAAVRWISAEPLLGPVRLDRKAYPESHYEDWLRGQAWDDVSGLLNQEIWGTDEGPTLDWVVVGGESGKDARPMHPDWARSLRDQCAAADVPFFFKQWGEWYPAFANDYAIDASSVREDRVIDGAVILRLGKKRAGRELDGKLHDEYPRQHGSAQR